MPFPNEHAARLEPPSKYEKFRRENDKFGPGIHAVFGITKAGKAELQSIHFDKNKFTPEQAKAWCRDHGHKVILFEPATNKKSLSVSDIMADTRMREGYHRQYALEQRTIDKEKRTVELSFASETPVDRWYGQEILDCAEKSCDLSRLKDGAPLLHNHNPSEQIGVVEDARMHEDRKGRATVRFSRSQKGEEAFQDVIDGIRRKVSVGYQVNKMEPDNDAAEVAKTGVKPKEEEELPMFRITSWVPYELSLVSLPADNSVGVGRSQTNQSITTMPDPIPAGTDPTPAITVNEKDVRAAEQNRVREIYAIAARFKVPDERRDKAVNDGESLDAYKDWVLKEHLKAEPVQVSPDIGMSRREKKRYSLVRALALLANNRPLDGLEKEASDATAVRIKNTPQGFFIPHDLTSFDDPEMTRAMIQMSPSMRANLRTMSASTFAQGGAAIQTDVLGGSLIELLRNRMYLTRLGCRNLSGLVGNIAIPRQSGPATAYWLAEGATLTATNQALAQLGLTPKRLAAQTVYTKQLLAQSSLDVEAFIREDLMAVLAIAKDLDGLSGTGGSQPLGILNTPNIGSFTIGGATAWANVVNFESTVAAANADVPTMNWLMSPTARGKWKTYVKVANYPVFLIEDNEANGYPVFATNQLSTTNQAIFGNFADCIYGDWAGWDVVVDPYTQAATGAVVITMMIFCDFGVRHPASFCISLDSAAQ